MTMEDFCRRVTALVVLCICVVASSVDATIVARVVPHPPPTVVGSGLGLGPPLTVLTYHNGSLMTAGPVIPVYLIWYGNFTRAQRTTIKDFFASLSPNASARAPSVRSWWSLTSGYKDTTGTPVAQSLSVAGEVFFPANSIYTLADADIEALVVRSLRTLPANSNAIYAVLTAADVEVEEFCSDRCASHFASNKTSSTKGKRLPYIWAGNPGTQCPGLCAWPFAKPEYGLPDFVPLVAPNGDVGIDGLLINLVSALAGTVTNPFDTGYYQGDASAPLEAATACAGIFGAFGGAGYPGILLRDKATNASFNTYGIHKREFFMPALWYQSSSLCTPP